MTERLRKQISKGYDTGLAGTAGAYHIDHMYSIMAGYTTGVSPLVIGNILNLKMIPWEENLQKHASSSIKLEVLLASVNYTAEQSQVEFEEVMRLIRNNIDPSTPISGARIVEHLYESTVFIKRPI